MALVLPYIPRNTHLGVVPRGWPGEDKFPPQPIVSQMHGVLRSYEANGGSYRPVDFECGHSPHIEKPEDFRQTLFDFLDGNNGARYRS